MGNCRSRQKLFLAIQKGDTEQVRSLAARLGDVNFREEKTGYYPLHVAAICGNTELVILLTELDADLECRDSNGRTPLYLAALSGCDDVVAELLSRGAETDARTHDGLTPFFAACWRGHVDSVKLLVSSNASLTVRNTDSQYAWEVATDWNHREVVEYLLATAKGPNCTMIQQSLANCLSKTKT